MKKLIIISILSFVFTANIYAYVDMSNVSQRADDLNMTTSNYAYSMALAGLLTGSMFGLFLWKSK